MECGGVVAGDAVWRGEVLVHSDVVVPAGATLRLEAGTRVSFAPRPRWTCAVFRSAPEGWPIEATRRELCDIVVQGRLEALGTQREPVALGLGEDWGGLTVLGRGRGELRRVRLRGAKETALQVFDQARLRCQDCALEGGEKGLWAWGFSRLRFQGGEIVAGRWGLIGCDAAQARLEDCRVAGADVAVSACGWSVVEARDCRLEGSAEGCAHALDHGWLTLTNCVLGGRTRTQDQARVEARACAPQRL